MKTLNPNNRNPRYDGLPFWALHKILMDACNGVAKPGVQVGVGNHTTAEFMMVAHDDPQKIAVKYHGALIAYIYDDQSAMIWNRGFKTKSTKQRLDWVLLPLGYRMTQVQRSWKVYSIQTGAYRDFMEGMVVTRGRF